MGAMAIKKILVFCFTTSLLFSFRDAGSGTVRRSIFNRHLDGEVYVQIVKSDYELKVYDKDGWYATYPVVFGSKSLDDKMMAGDRKTPEGEYHITSKREHEKWDKMMLLDYPTQADYDKFNQ